MNEVLPPGCIRLRSGRLVHRIFQEVEGRRVRVDRPVSLSLEEAKRLRHDYFDPRLGWIMEGYKLSKDRSRASILSDNSGVNFVGDIRDYEEEDLEELEAATSEEDG